MHFDYAAAVISARGPQEFAQIVLIFCCAKAEKIGHKIIKASFLAYSLLYVGIISRLMQVKLGAEAKSMLLMKVHRLRPLRFSRRNSS
jgi:hypothetical protein